MVMQYEELKYGLSILINNQYACNMHANKKLVNKCYKSDMCLSSKSAYYYDFWRSYDTEDWSNDAENTAAHHRN